MAAPQGVSPSSPHLPSVAPTRVGGMRCSTGGGQRCTNKGTSGRLVVASLAEAIARYRGGVESCGWFSSRKFQSKIFVN